MEAVKNPNQGYNQAPEGGVANYTKITDIPDSYAICSVSRNDTTDNTPSNCNNSDPIIAVPWDSNNNQVTDIDDGLQKITLVIKYEGTVVTTLEDYKVDR